jgi:predicted nucleic acid-binding Zn ribbon protein
VSRDPIAIGAAISDTFRVRGWQRRFDVAKVLGRWEEVVGETVAAHCRPVRLDDQGMLDVVADSAVWATQLTFLQGTLLDRLGKVCGPGLVTSLRVRAEGAWQRRR